jgi:hypothetical protein
MITAATTTIIAGALDDDAMVVRAVMCISLVDGSRWICGRALALLATTDELSGRVDVVYKASSSS